MLYGWLKSEKQPYRKVFIFVVSKEMEILGLRVTTATARDRSMEI
jgi:hypothetical protein